MDLAKRQSVNKYFLYMGFIVVLLLTALSLGGCGQSYDKHVQMVRNGTMQISPNVQVGPAFDQFLQIANGNTLKRQIIHKLSNSQENVHGKINRLKPKYSSF